MYLAHRLPILFACMNYFIIKITIHQVPQLPAFGGEVEHYGDQERLECWLAVGRESRSLVIQGGFCVLGVNRCWVWSPLRYDLDEVTFHSLTVSCSTVEIQRLSSPTNQELGKALESSMKMFFLELLCSKSPGNENGSGLRSLLQTVPGSLSPHAKVRPCPLP